MPNRPRVRPVGAIMSFNVGDLVVVRRECFESVFLASQMKYVAETFGGVPIGEVVGIRNIDPSITGELNHTIIRIDLGKEFPFGTVLAYTGEIMPYRIGPECDL